MRTEHHSPSDPRAGSRRPRGWWCVLVLLGASAVATGCAKAKAEPLPESPPLIMPAPPPRVLAPVDGDPVAAVPAVPETETPATAAAPRTPPRTAPRRPNATPSEPERPPDTAPAAQQTPAPAPPEPARELRSVDAAAEQKVRDQLGRAAKDLSRVDYQKLSADGRLSYDQSKRFAEQAEQALKDRNTPFAATLADKAAALAAELLGR